MLLFKPRLVRVSPLLLCLALPRPVAAATDKTNARVTQVIREVDVLEANSAARRALVNDSVRQGTAVKTGSESRAELTFADLTITRLGANTLFSFRKAGHEANLTGGSVLLAVPKNAGGGAIFSPAVTAGLTGTTVILEAPLDGSARLTVLEGSARLTLVKQPTQTRTVRAGQMLEVPARAVRLPEPRATNLNQLMKSSPLTRGFRPLPTQSLINAAMQQQQQSAPGQGNPPSRPAGPGMTGAPPAPPPPGRP